MTTWLKRLFTTRRGLEARIKELEDEVQFLADPKILRAQIEAGRFEAWIKDNRVLELFGWAFWELIVRNNCKNYAEVTLQGLNGERMLVTIQRRDGGKTPHELRLEAEARADEGGRLADAVLVRWRDCPDFLRPRLEAYRAAYLEHAKARTI